MFMQERPFRVMACVGRVRSDAGYVFGLCPRGGALGRAFRLARAIFAQFPSFLAPGR
jgi:hypothetical protein